MLWKNVFESGAGSGCSGRKAFRSGAESGYAEDKAFENGAGNGCFEKMCLKVDTLEKSV